MSKWISVKDLNNRPDHFERILVYLKDKTCEDYFVATYYKDEKTIEAQFYIDSPSINTDFPPILYWAKLPNPPEEK